MYYADSLGFLGLPGGKIQVDPELRLDLVHLTSVPPWAKTMDEALKAHNDFLKQIENQPRLRVVRSKEELDEFNTVDTYNNRTAVVLGMQHVPEDAEPDDIGKLYQAGIRVMGIAYDEKNSFGSGWKNPDMGLTKEGEKFLKALAENGMILDLSHASHQTAQDAIVFVIKNFAGLPVFASHTGVFQVYKHPRNLSISLLQQIADMGGVVGLLIQTFLLDEKDNSPEAFIKHFRYAIRELPADSVCIGSDAPHVNVGSEEARKNFNMKKSKLDPDGKMRVRFPEYVEDLTGPDMMEKIEDEISLSASLWKRIVGVLGKNLLRFFEKSL